VFCHQFQNTVNQRVTPQLTRWAQRYLTAQMRLPIRVAPGATERTFAGISIESSGTCQSGCAPKQKEFHAKCGWDWELV